MPPGARTATVRAFAKINLDLRVFGRRADGYHRIHTVFQTISLADRLTIDYTPARRTELTLASNPDIPDNLVLRAARLALDALRLNARIHLSLHKRIPMGGGLGGGSSDAAAVLLALPALAGRPLPETELRRLAASLGSDVPFFLYGGTAIGLGRGEELYPAPASPSARLLLAVPPIGISTGTAYRTLNRPPETQLTSSLPDPRMEEFQSLCWALAAPGGRWWALCENDFEVAVFSEHPQIARLHRALSRTGASLVRMTGSGSTLFALFDSAPLRRRALSLLAPRFPDTGWFFASFLSRLQYQRCYRRALARGSQDSSWPPRDLPACPKKNPSSL